MQLHFCESLNFLPIPLDHIIPHREWTNRIIISIHPRISFYFIQRTIENHDFLGFRVLRESYHFIGMVISSLGFIVAPVATRSRFLHLLLESTCRQIYKNCWIKIENYISLWNLVARNTISSTKTRSLKIWIY